jgi:hypothetical protein
MLLLNSDSIKYLNYASAQKAKDIRVSQRYLFMKNIIIWINSHTMAVLLAYILVISPIGMVYTIQTVDAHCFSEDDKALFLALIYQINVKTQLIDTNFPSNITLAIDHAEDTAELLNDAYNFGEDIVDDNDFIREYNEQINNINSTVQALILANVVDDILRNYGDGLEIDFDLTNMSNLVMPNVSHSAMMMGDENMKNSSMIREKSNYNNSNIIVNPADYQTAQALSDKALQIFNKELKPIAATSNVTTFIVKLENGLIQLRDALDNNAAPMDMMMIVHTQIHPNLQKAFNLQLVS